MKEETAIEVEGSVQKGNDSGGRDGFDVTPFCIPCKGNVCFCEDKQQVTFFPSDEEYYDCLDEASRIQVGDLFENQRYWSSDDHEQAVEGAVSQTPEVQGGSRGLRDDHKNMCEEQQT